MPVACACGQCLKKIALAQEATPDPTQVVRTTKAARKPSAIAVRVVCCRAIACACMPPCRAY